MKKLFIAAFMLIGMFNTTLAQDASAYQTALKKNIAVLDTARKISTFQEVANAFERMLSVEKNDWLLYYYASMSLQGLAEKQTDPEGIDAILDKAQTYSDAAAALNPKSADILCLNAAISFSRINVDFMARGPQYSAKAEEMLMAARKIDANNPRVYLLLGQKAFFTPEQFGGDKKLAKKLLEKAVELYAQAPAETNNPHWGQPLAQNLLNNMK